MVRNLIYFFIGLFLSFASAKSQGRDSVPIMVIENAPIFKGNIKDFIQKNLNYPKTAIKDSIEGSVIIEYWIDIDGKTIDHKVLKGIRKDLDDEAIRVTKLIKYESPATQRGIARILRFCVPVDFKLSNSKT